ncbi:hypothetical protein K439DRAFT_1624742 [Ramaria rubella]|nr:hypothetical protein K439DRAFT_1624742 [Ramaria rubella]
MLQSGLRSFYSLPPHTTDQLQPLDVGVFGPVQIAWVRRSQAAAAEGAVITTSMVVLEYLQVRKQAMIKKCIESVFRKTGIHPFNPDLFTDEDFVASLAWVPNSAGPVRYPHIPSSPDSAKLTTSESDDYMDAPEGETGCGLDSQSNIDGSTTVEHRDALEASFMDISDSSDSDEYTVVPSDSNNGAEANPSPNHAHSLKSPPPPVSSTPAWIWGCSRTLVLDHKY